MGQSRSLVAVRRGRGACRRWGLLLDVRWAGRAGKPLPRPWQELIHKTEDRGNFFSFLTLVIVSVYLLPTFYFCVSRNGNVDVEIKVPFAETRYLLNLV